MSTKLLSCLSALAIFASVGCSTDQFAKSIPERFDWDAAEFFEDPEVIQLCEFISAGDSNQVSKLILEGVNADACGEGNMTPLIWAYFHDQLACFEQLLKAGADPNIQVTSVLRTRGEIKPKDSAVSLVAKRTSPYFKLILSHSNVNFEQTDSLGRNILDNILFGGGPYMARIEKSLELGANLHAFNSSDRSPPMTAAVFGKYDACLHFLGHGYNIALYENNGLRKLIHFVVSPRFIPKSGPQVGFYDEVLRRLLREGESVEQAREDLQRWASWGELPIRTMKTLKEREITERKEREAKEKVGQQTE